jgi:LytS/YehU family sensor histidine kinase
MSVPSLIFQPIVENAIWHGLAPKGKGKITVSIKKISSKLLEAIVEDNGVGIDVSNDQENKLYTSKGMKLVEERLKPGGSLNVSSGTGKGTSIIMLIPYKPI